MIFYKEWIKTRWYLLAMFLLTSGFAGYGLLRLHRVVGLQGVAHAWEAMLTHDVVFIDIMDYVPLVAGILLSLVQFVPEMYHKCLKLTLHLPIAHFKLVNHMLLFGVAAILLITLSNYAFMWSYMSRILASELWSRIFITALPWYMASFAGYLLTSWCILEPSWKRRVFNIAVSVLVLKVYFISETPAAFASFLPWLAVYTVGTASLCWISIARFKEGKQ